jgi:hypothetical protein
MSDDNSEDDDPVTVADLGESDGHTTRKGQFNDSDDTDGDGDDS